MVAKPKFNNQEDAWKNKKLQVVEKVVAVELDLGANVVPNVVDAVVGPLNY